MNLFFLILVLLLLTLDERRGSQDSSRSSGEYKRTPNFKKNGRSNLIKGIYNQLFGSGSKSIL